MATTLQKALQTTIVVMTCYSIAVILFYIVYNLDDSDHDANGDSESDRFFLSRNAIIIGTVKDGASTLQPILLKMDAIAKHFNSTKFIVFESNSEDNTLEILLEWKGSNEHKIILNDDKLIADILGSNLSAIRPMGREEVYVEYRNLMIFFAQKYATSPTNTFLIIIDLDILSISNSWQFILNEVYFGMITHRLDMICLNAVSVNAYGMRDSYAIVDDEDNWVRGYLYNLFDDLFLFPYRLYQYLWWKYFVVVQNQLFPLETYRFIDVKSCFGGLTFYYSMARILDTECKYIHFEELSKMESPNPYDSQSIVHRLKNPFALRDHHVNVTCEHIPFHFCLRNHGFKVGLSTRPILFFG